MIVTEWEIQRVPGVNGYLWRMVCEGQPYRSISDGSLGAIMSAFRHCLRMIAKDHGHEVEVDRRDLTGPVVIDQLTVERTRTQRGYRIWMQSGHFTFEAYADPLLESIIAAMSAAMKFFAAKYGIVYLYDDVARNVEAAHEHGFE